MLDSGTKFKALFVLNCELSKIMNYTKLHAFNMSISKK